MLNKRILIFSKVVGLILLILFHQSSHAFTNLTYEIKHLADEKKLQVKLEFVSTKSNHTKLNIPSKIWGHDLDKQIRNIEVYNGQFIKQTNTIIHKPNQKLTILYEIVNIEENDGSSYYSYINAKGFYFLYKLALIYPSSLESSKITIDLSFITPNTIFTNYGNISHNTKPKLNITINEFIEEGFAISGSQDLVQKLDNGNNSIIFWGFNDQLRQDIETLLYRITSAQEQFFKTKQNSNLFILINNQRDENDFNGSLIGNTGFYFLPSKFNIRHYNIKHLLAHENLHKWIGKDLECDGAENTCKWFTEGFTDYFTNKINLNSGIITFTEYLNNYNEVLKEYYISPYVLYDNDTISHLYWKNSYTNRLPYNRGYLIAQELDTRIQNFTKHKLSLDNVLQKIIENNIKGTKYKFNTNSLINVINELIQQDYSKIINQFVYYGEIKLSKNSINNIRLDYQEIAVSDCGFDITNSQKTITQLNIDSNAYKAGLRNGNKFKKLTISKANAKSLSLVMIELVNGKMIQYYAEEKFMHIPQYNTLQNFQLHH